MYGDSEAGSTYLVEPRIQPWYCTICSAGVRSLSKLGKLKKEAYQAGKKRNWPEAIAIYERILEIDKSNPTLINELGDVCLKNQESARAISHFLNAAAKYRQTGLLNNAVAIYKKILRHDAKSLNAHWYLAEIRASQGLLVEGQVHALQFLAASENLQSDVQEIFQKRCLKLLGLFPESTEVLDRLATVFQASNLALEHRRVSMLRACIEYDSGQEEEARTAINELLEQVPELCNYPEFAQWQGRVGPEEGGPNCADVNSLDLDGAAGVAVGGVALDDTPDTVQAMPREASVDDGVDHAMDETGGSADDKNAVADDAAAGASDTDRSEASGDFGEVDLNGSIGDAPTADAADDGDQVEVQTDFGAVNLGQTVGETVAAIEVSDADEPADDDDIAEVDIGEVTGSADATEDADSDEAKDNDGCFNIDVDFGASLDDLAEAAAAAAGKDNDAAESAAAVKTDEAAVGAAVVDADETVASVDSAATSPASSAAAESGHVDLLAEILAEDQQDEKATPNREVDTITGEIGQMVCPDTDDDDPSSLYAKGMVYLEMGLFEQACECFERSSEAPEEALRSLEMWGIALVRSGSIAEAIKVLEGALAVPVGKAADQLGLLYQLGRAHETADHEDDARDYFERVQAVEPSFLDVGQRLATLATT